MRKKRKEKRITKEYKKKKKVIAIITAAGAGKRLKGQVKKQFRSIVGKPVVARTLDVFEEVRMIDEIILALPGGTEDYCRKNIINKYGYKKNIRIVKGGARRQDSVFNALKQVEGDCRIVVIHDGVRPFVTKEMIEDSVRKAEKYGASMAAVPLRDTIKKADSNGFVLKTLSREKIWRTQTPQSFRYDLIMTAHEKSRKNGFHATDDAVLVERLKKKVKIIGGSYGNVKITTAQDLKLAEAMLKGKDTRYGIGYDVHRLVTGRELVLGGVKIPFKKGLLGHSDGDALVHSICDALLGAMGKRDIGVYFPDTDNRYRGISSIILLSKVVGMLLKAGYAVNNADSMIIAQEPKMSGYVNGMRKVIAHELKTKTGNVAIKATTNEGLGLIGKGKGIAAYSVVSIRKQG